MLPQHLGSQLGQCGNKVLLRRCCIHLQRAHGFFHIFAEHCLDGIRGKVHAESRRNLLFIHRDHILEVQFRIRLLVKAFSGKDVDFRIIQLLLNNFTLFSQINHMSGQIGSIGHTAAECGGTDTFFRADNAHNVQIFPFLDQGLHVILIVGHIFPYLILTVQTVQRRYRHQLEFQRHQFLISPLFGCLCIFKLLTAHDPVNDFLQLVGVFQTHRVGHVIGDLAWIGQNNDQLIVAFRPSALQYVILRFQDLPVVHHFIEHIGCHIHGHHGISHDLIEQGRRICLQNFLTGIGIENAGFDTIMILYRIDGVIDLIVVFFQMGLERLQVVGSHLCKHLGNHLLFHQCSLLRFAGGLNGSAKGRHHGCHICCFRLNRQRIVGKGICLNLIDILLKTRGQRHNQRYADDANGACKGCQQRSSQLGAQVVEAEGKGRKIRHGSLTHILVLGRSHGCNIDNEGIGVINDFTILDTHNAVCVFLCQLRIVGNHDHQTVLCHILQQIHDLHAGLRVQCAGGFVRQQNIRIVYQCAGNGHALHLTAGHLVGPLVQLVAQTHILQCLLGPLAALCTGNAGDGQSQFHVCQNTLVRNQVVTLENETNRMISVGIPVPVCVFLCRNTVDNQIAAVIPVQSANDIQQSRLTAAAGTQNCHKFIVAQVQADTVQRCLNQLTGNVLLSDILDLQHILPLPVRCICNQFNMLVLTLQDYIKKCFN